MKNRLERVNEILKRELSELIARRIRFDAPMVTIQQVDITPDLKHAHVWVGVLGSEEQKASAIAELHAARAELQRDVSKRVILKYTPHLHFKLDQSGERGDRVLQVLDELGFKEEPAPKEEDE